MKMLPAQHLKPSYYADMEKQLKEIFYKIVFLPVLRKLDKYSAQVRDLELKNDANDALRAALRNGKVQYANGVFSGDFSAAIGRALRAMGAKFEKRTKTFNLEASKVPSWVSAESGSYTVKARESHKAIKEQLTKIQEDLDTSVDRYSVDAWLTVDKIEQGFKTVGKNLEVMPQISDDSRARLSREYSQNMKLWVKKFSKDMIVDLRGIVSKNAEQGYRFDKLIDSIEGRYGVAQSKAKFLARQETSLFMSNYRKQRFAEAGIGMYKWQTAHDERVRTSHKDLNGKVCSYDNPPIVDRDTGRRGNPGEDFNCRCVDNPILSVVEEAA